MLSALNPFSNANVSTLSYMGKLADDRQENIDDVILFRRYAEGDQDDVLSQKEKNLGGVELRLNICQKIITTETDRLNMRGVRVIVPDNEQTSEDVSQQIAKWFKLTRADLKMLGVHDSASRDGDAYIIVEFDKKKNRPIFTVNEQYDGETGVDFRYLDNNPDTPMYAVKRWVAEENTADGTRTIRMNIYMADRVLKLTNSTTTTNGKTNQAGWYPYTVEGEIDDVIEVTLYGQKFTAGVQWWTDTRTETGQPLGIPVIHFRRAMDSKAYGRSAIADIAPGVQDTVNRNFSSNDFATRTAGFPINWATKFDPESNFNNADTGSNQVSKKVEAKPGAVLYNTEDGSFGQLPAANLQQLVDVLDAVLRYAATITDTPMSALNPSGAIAAEGTLQQQEAPLLAKIKKIQISFGNSWEDVAKMMVVTDIVFGTNTSKLTLDTLDEIEFDAQWDSPQTRNESNELANAEIKKRLGVPDDQIFTELKYTPEQIAQWKTDSAVKRGAIMGTLAQKITEMEQNNARQVLATSNGTTTTGNNGGSAAIGANGNGSLGAEGNNVV
jgi:hypothetical protein